MDWNNYLFPENEQPLDRLVDGYSRTSIFRTIAFIGDSLSSGEFETRDAGHTVGVENPKYLSRLFHRYTGISAAEYRLSWGQYIARKNGLKAYNFSRGGMTAREYLQSFAESRDFWNPDQACQAYVIALGVNDLYNQKQEVGTIADVDPTDWRKNGDTFIGNYAAIVSRYKEISPDAKFFFVTFPKDDLWVNPAASQGLCDSVYALADHFDNAYVIDLYRYAPAYDQQFREQFNLYGHSNASGYILVAQIIDSYIDYIVRHNPKDFNNVPFINTDIRY